MEKMNKPINTVQLQVQSSSEKSMPLVGVMVVDATYDTY